MHEELIPFMNKLHEVLNSGDNPRLFHLPQIVVVGSQSAGKSSVLESIAGREFLPRGEGLVTRRPLVLKCIKINQGEDYATFAHKPGKTYRDFDEVRQEIENATNELCSRYQIIDNPIDLCIYSQNVVDITLVDLPGQVQNAIADQPEDIAVTIKAMIMRYIEPENSLILAITPATDDLANSVAINLAKKVDPEGVRTLGVMTKLDIMNHGTDAYDILEGGCTSEGQVTLKLGYVGVVCRSQADIKNKVKFIDHLAKERDFFANHPKYRDIATRQGTLFIRKKLKELLKKHILGRLDDLNEEIIRELRDKKDKLTKLEKVMLRVERRREFLMLSIEKYRSEYSKSIDGHSLTNITAFLRGGVKIQQLFEIFRKALAEIGPFEDLTDENVLTATMNAGGATGTFFVNDLAVQLLIKLQIQKLRGQCLICAEQVFTELMKIASDITVDELKPYQNLQAEMIRVVQETLIELQQPAIEKVNELVDMEIGYINTLHPDLISDSEAIMETREDELRQGTASLIAEASSSTGDWMWSRILRRSAPQTKGAGSELPSQETSSTTSTTETDLDMLRRMRTSKKVIESYFLIVRKTLSDTVPKAIMLKLVNKSKDIISQTLLTGLDTEDKLDFLFNEPISKIVERQKLRREVEQLEKACTILAELGENLGRSDPWRGR